jgi:hypothetical protein
MPHPVVAENGVKELHPTPEGGIYPNKAMPPQVRKGEL